MKPKWAVLVYMGADDPDDRELVLSAFKDIKEIRDAGSSPAVRIAVQVDLQLFPPVRFAVEADGSVSGIERRRESSAGQAKTLTAFLKWAEKKFDAERYLLVLWGHGVGVGFQLTLPASLADVVFDADDGLEVRELAQVLSGFKKRRGRALDLLGFDACYMSGIEVGYELRNLVDVLVGGQGSLPLAGWPYTPILRHLKLRPRQSTRSLATAITREVVKSFKTADNVTQTALAPKGSADNVAKAFQALVTAYLKAPPRGSVRGAIGRALRTSSFFEARQFIDLIDLCKRVRKTTRDPAVGVAAANVIQALERSAPHLIVSHHRRGRRVKDLNGASIYLKHVRASKQNGEEDVDVKIGRYRRLEFVKFTGWQRLVDTL
jgi:Clostripain family